MSGRSELDVYLDGALLGTREALLAQGEAVGVPSRLGERILRELEGALPAALGAACSRAGADGWQTPILETIAEQTTGRAERFLNG